MEEGTMRDDAGSPTAMMIQDRRATLTRQRSRSSIESSQGLGELRHDLAGIISTSRRGSRVQDQGLLDEIHHYAENKRRLAAKTEYGGSSPTGMTTQDRRAMMTRQRSRSSIDSGQGLDDFRHDLAGIAPGSRRGSRIQEQRLRDEIQQYAEKKRLMVANNEMSETERRENIRAQLEQDINRRVQEAFDCQTRGPPPAGRHGNRTQSADNIAQQRTLQELERLNAHIDLTDKEQAYIRRQRCQILEARRKVMILPPSTHYHSGQYGDELADRFNDSNAYSATFGSSHSENGYFREPDFNFKLGYDASNLSYKSQEHYAKIAAKAVANFGSLSLSERHEFFYVFTKTGFREAMHTGKLPDGSELKSIGRGRYVDTYGIIRDQHGPFWPSDYGPLFPTPSHKRLMGTSQELLTYGTRDRNTATVDNQQTVYSGKWRGVQIIYDSERSARDYIPPPVQDNICPSLVFESRFECGNLRQARRVGHYEYELVLKTDMYTKRHTQWFYFRVTNALPDVTYKFKIINLLKRDSLYNHGMRPLLYSEKNARSRGVGWTRQGHHISYTRNSFNLQCSLLSRDTTYYLLEWQMQFPHADDTTYLSHCYPYTYTDLKNDLDLFLSDTGRSLVMRREVMCETRVGNSCFLLTVTNFDKDESPDERSAIVISARVHPGESNSSWMMYGLLEYLTGNSQTAKDLRDAFVFKIIPMLNPDGVIVGNYRCSLMARDLNRNYRHPRKESFPTIFSLKSMMDKLSKHNKILFYCDLHGHSRKQNVFMYGCNMADRHPSDANKNHTQNSGGNQQLNKFTEGILKERLLPWLMAKKSPDKFSFSGCKFKIRRCKESTGRVVMFRQLGIDNSFTMEATFCGTTICKGDKRHFNIDDFQDMGRILSESILEYHVTQTNAVKRTEVLLDLTKAITQQVLITQGKLPADVPDITTEEGKYRLKEYCCQQSVQQNKVMTTFLDLLCTPSKDTSNTIQKNKANGEHGDNSQDLITSKSALNKVEHMFGVMTGQTIDGCVDILEQLNAEDALVESDSSDSDSESEPEMKYPESKSKRKKRKSKKKQTATASTSTTADQQNKKNSGNKNQKEDTGLPAISNLDEEMMRKKKGTSMGRYVKAVKSHPSYVNKYDGRSNGGIPCFSEERLIERQAKRMSDIQKQMEEEHQRRKALYYLGDDSEDSYGGLYGDYTNPLLQTTSALPSHTINPSADRDDGQNPGVATSDFFAYHPLSSINGTHPADKLLDVNSLPSDSGDEEGSGATKSGINKLTTVTNNGHLSGSALNGTQPNVMASLSQVSSVSNLVMNMHRHSSHNARMLPMSLIHSRTSDLGTMSSSGTTGTSQPGLMVTSVSNRQTVKPLSEENFVVTGRPSGMVKSQRRRHSIDMGGKQSPPSVMNREYTDVLFQRLKKHRQHSDVSLNSSKSNSSADLETDKKHSSDLDVDKKQWSDLEVRPKAGINSKRKQNHVDQGSRRKLSNDSGTEGKSTCDLEINTRSNSEGHKTAEDDKKTDNPKTDS